MAIPPFLATADAFSAGGSFFSFDRCLPGGRPGGHSLGVLLGATATITVTGGVAMMGGVITSRSSVNDFTSLIDIEASDLD